MSDSFKSLRRDFKKGTLDDGGMPSNPLDLLLEWYQLAMDSGEPDPNAMSLSTVDLDGYAVSRVVLLRDTSEAGLSFFTNYRSAKAIELEANPKAGLQFFWKFLERQVRIKGSVERVSEAESDAYFASRPRESQIGAWASPQSNVILSRDILEKSVAEYTAKFASELKVPRPPHWGGFRLSPIEYEFWQGRPSRLHDRLRAALREGVWTWERLAP